MPKYAHEQDSVFWKRHGADAAVEAHQVSLGALQRWARACEDAGGIDTRKPCAEKAPRRNRPPKVVKKIRRLRRQCPDMGKQPLRVLPEPWRRRLRSSLPRIIEADQDKMGAAPARVDSWGRPQAAKKQPKKRRPAGHAAELLEVFAAVAGVRVRDGVRRCLAMFIDPGRALLVAGPASGRAAAVPPRPCVPSCSCFTAPCFVRAHQRATEQERRMYNTSTAVRECANKANAQNNKPGAAVSGRPGRLNRALAKWPAFYNTERPHRALGLEYPVQALFTDHPKRQIL